MVSPCCWEDSDEKLGEKESFLQNQYAFLSFQLAFSSLRGLFGLPDLSSLHLRSDLQVLLDLPG